MRTVKCVFVRPGNCFLLRFRTTFPVPDFTALPFPSVYAIVLLYAASTRPAPSTFTVPARLIAAATLESHLPAPFPAKSCTRETSSARL